MSVTRYTRRAAVAALVAAAVSGVAVEPAAAQGQISPHILDLLQSQGFRVISARKTWLGRVRVIARSGRYDRELVYVPSTGEILRDYWEELNDDGPGSAFERQERDRDRDDRDDDDDDDDDDGDDDDD